MKLSVIIPVYNEKATIEQLVARVKDVDLEKEIIIVDDCSEDGTRDIVRKLADGDPAPWHPPAPAGGGKRLPAREDARVSSSGRSRYSGEPPAPAGGGSTVRVIMHERNQGKGAALRSGIGAATGDFVIIQDSDLEYDPQDYPLLLEPLIQDKADVVYGSRFMGGRPHRVVYYWHSVGNRLLTLLSNMFTNINLTEMETCYKAFRREIIQSIKIEEDRFGFEPEITAKIAKRKCRIYEVGISYYGRTYAEGKKIGWKDGFRAIYCIVKYNLFR